MRLALAVLVAGIAVAVAVAVFVVGGSGSTSGPGVSPSPVAQAIRDGVLVETPAAVLGTCRSASSQLEVPARCPAAIPRADAEWGQGRALDRSPCEYLIDLEPGPSARGAPKRISHLLFGGRCGRFDLGAHDGTWPKRWSTPDDLGLIGVRPLEPGRSGRGAPARPSVHGRLTIAGRPALLVRHPPQPLTSVHTGHLALVWNEASAGYVVSGHLPDAPTPRQNEEAIRALRETALAMHSAKPGNAR